MQGCGGIVNGYWAGEGAWANGHETEKRSTFNAQRSTLNVQVVGGRGHASVRNPKELDALLIHQVEHTCAS